MHEIEQQRLLSTESNCAAKIFVGDAFSRKFDGNYTRSVVDDDYNKDNEHFSKCSIPNQSKVQNS